MNDSMISKAIKRSNLNLVLICLAGLLVVTMLVAANMRYITNFVLGPFEVTPEALAGVRDASKLPQYWVRVTGYDIYDLDVQYVETSDSGKETVEFSYLALELGERLLLVKQPGMPKMDTTLTGSLQTLTPEEQAEIIDYYVADDPSLEGVFLPYLMHTGSFRTSGWIVFILGLAAAAACLFGLFLYVQRSADPAAHPVMKSLARLGPADFIVPQLEGELAMPHTLASKKFHLTKNWLIHATASQFQATRFEDIAWSYLHVHTTRTYGIAVAKVYSVMYYDKYGSEMKWAVGNKEAPALQILEAGMQRNPWAFRGYSAELIKAWKKERPRFLAEVAKRRQQYKEWAANKAEQPTPGDAGASHQVNSGIVMDQDKNGG